MTRRRRRVFGILPLMAGLILAVAACGSGGPGGSGGSGKFPSHDINFIVPYAPGGGSDLQARGLLPGLQQALGVKVHIVYKTGGGGAAGFLQVHSAAPDGYTIANVVVPNIIVTAQGQDVGYKPTGFSYIAMTQTTPDALVVAKNGKFKTLQQFVAYAKANPGKVTIAGTGTTGKENVAEIAKATGIKVTYVPVSAGVGAILPDIEGGHVDAGEFGSSHVLEHTDSLRALGLAGTQASPSLPGVPTFASQGYQGYSAATSWGVMAPPGTPASVVKILNSAIEKANAMAANMARMKKNGLIPLTQTPAQAMSFVVAAENSVAADQKLLPLVGG